MQWTDSDDACMPVWKGAWEVLSLWQRKVGDAGDGAATAASFAPRMRRAWGFPGNDLPWSSWQSVQSGGASAFGAGTEGAACAASGVAAGAGVTCAEGARPRSPARISAGTVPITYRLAAIASPLRNAGSGAGPRTGPAAPDTLPGVDLRDVPVLSGAVARRARLVGTRSSREGHGVQEGVRRGVAVVMATEARGRARSLRREVVTQRDDRYRSERKRKVERRSARVALEAVAAVSRIADLVEVVLDASEAEHREVLRQVLARVDAGDHPLERDRLAGVLIGRAPRLVRRIRVVAHVAFFDGDALAAMRERRREPVVALVTVVEDDDVARGTGPGVRDGDVLDRVDRPFRVGLHRRSVRLLEVDGAASLDRDRPAALGGSGDRVLERVDGLPVAEGRAA